jgi:hypothetical protein
MPIAGKYRRSCHVSRSSPVVRHDRSAMPAGPYGGFLLMSSGVDRNRVALAMFENNQSLCRALGDFDSAGLVPDQMGVAGRASAISALVHAFHAGTARPKPIAGLLQGVQPLALDVGREKLVASSGPLWPALRCFGIAHNEPLVVAPWMAPRLRDELVAHLTNGAVLFGVRPASADQQKTCTQTLLQHSTHRVHTHEF